MEEGWIKLYRNATEDGLYFGGKFDGMHAWIDLLLTASPEKRATVTRRGMEVLLEPGDIVVSTRELASRWGWTRRTVESYLDQLQSDCKVSVLKSKSFSLVRIENWKQYIGVEPINEPVNEPINEPIKKRLKKLKTSVVSTKIQSLFEPINEPINEPTKKDKGNGSIKQREEGFLTSLSPFKSKFGEEMIQDFFNYWSELNPSRTKMRWEMQKTWETGKRLATWAAKDYNRNKNKRYGQEVTDKRRGTEVTATSAEDYEGRF